MKCSLYKQDKFSFVHVKSPEANIITYYLKTGSIILPQIIEQLESWEVLW